jgi:hypothetical protein
VSGGATRTTGASSHSKARSDDERRDLAAGTAGARGLVQHDHLAGLARRGQDRVFVEGQQRAQVEHLDVDPSVPPPAAASSAPAASRA